MESPRLSHSGIPFCCTASTLDRHTNTWSAPIHLRFQSRHPPVGRMAVPLRSVSRNAQWPQPRPISRSMFLVFSMSSPNCCVMKLQHEIPIRFAFEHCNKRIQRRSHQIARVLAVCDPWLASVSGRIAREPHRAIIATIAARRSVRRHHKMINRSCRGCRFHDLSHCS